VPDAAGSARPPDAPGARGRLLGAVLVGTVLIAAAIGGILLLRGDRDDQTDYDDGVADRFLSVCTADAAGLGFVDPDGFCRCSYERIRAEIPFERFVEIDAAMAERSAPAPEEIVRIRSECYGAAPSATAVPPTSVPSVTRPPPGG
jgi:hypothetical protein